MEEIWKDIAGYEGIYQVSNFGRIKSLERIVLMRNGNNKHVKEKIKKTRKDSRGNYELVDLCRNKEQKTMLVHRIVAESFIDNPNNYKEVNHKDENKENNNVSNLEWCTRKYNSNYGSLPRKQIDILKKIKNTNKKMIKCTQDGKIFNSIQDAGQYYNIESSNIGRVCNKKRKSAGGRKFEYI